MPGQLIDPAGIIPVSDPVVEAHHRIANNLAIIAALIRSELLTLAKVARPNAGYTRRLLQQMSLRIDAVGRLHRLLMDTPHGGTVELRTYLREIVDAVRCSLTDVKHTKIVCRFGAEATVSAKQAAAIGLFVVEALVNSIKHAHPMDESGTIWINCKRASSSRLLVEIIDDGAGATLDLDAAASQAIGSGARLMRAIAHELGAELAFTKSNPGQIVRLELPPITGSNRAPHAQAAE
ncbi:MAG: sensor histidine kinase [Rhizobiales bacterium]|nr:sensor histidine kinase [Hyphomicrobiales bacterium]